MTLIPWRDEFSLGIASVDYEHRELIDLINDVHSRAQERADQDHVVAALGEIFARISAHFALEERVMRDANYAHLAEHKAEHEALLDEIRDIMDRVEEDGRYDEHRLGEELERWFTRHFKTQDARLHSSIGHGATDSLAGHSPDN